MALKILKTICAIFIGSMIYIIILYPLSCLFIIGLVLLGIVVQHYNPDSICSFFLNYAWAELAEVFKEVSVRNSIQSFKSLMKFMVCIFLFRPCTIRYSLDRGADWWNFLFLGSERLISMGAWIDHHINPSSTIGVYVNAFLYSVIISAIYVPVLILILLYIQISNAVGEALRPILNYILTPTLIAQVRDIGQGKLVLCQLSDLHMTSDGHQPYEIEQGQSKWPDGQPTPNTDELVSRVCQLTSAIVALDPPVVAFTGDITDLGQHSEWAEVERAIDNMPERLARLMIPGNHDVGINIGTMPDPSLENRKIRESDFIRGMRYLDHGAITPHIPPILPKNLCMEDLFPRSLKIEGGIRVIGLDSTRYLSKVIFSNAIGLIGPRQLRLLRDELASGEGPVIILLHHHVARLPSGFSAADPVMISLDGRELLEILCEYNRINVTKNPVLVLHGHKHMDFFGSFRSKRGGHVDVYAHPSSTMGHEIRGCLDGGLRFTSVKISEHATWIIETHRLARSGESIIQTPAYPLIPKFCNSNVLGIRIKPQTRATAKRE